jgi:hypothetical protein
MEYSHFFLVIEEGKSGGEGEGEGERGGNGEREGPLKKTPETHGNII